jgi:hypothetical protein
MGRRHQRRKEDRDHGHKEIIGTPPMFESGYALPMAGAGLGTKLIEDRFKASDAIQIVSRV